MSENNANDKGVLTDEKEEFLKHLETEFKDRYTEADEEFKAVWESDNPPPPIVLDWDKIASVQSIQIVPYIRNYLSWYCEAQYEPTSRRLQSQSVNI